MEKQVHPLRQWRQTNKKTLSDVARAVNVTGSHLSEIENGNNDPSLDLAVRLSRETGIPIEQFSREAAQ